MYRYSGVVSFNVMGLMVCARRMAITKDEGKDCISGVTESSSFY